MSVSSLALWVSIGRRFQVANDPIPLAGFIRFASKCGILRLKSHRILKYGPVMPCYQPRCLRRCGCLDLKWVLCSELPPSPGPRTACRLVGEHARALVELIGLRPLHVLLHRGIEVRCVNLSQSATAALRTHSRTRAHSHAHTLGALH